ncbi:hypothetical protein MMC22_009849 [Lobaria immixta]|nr:hypothetical protein [Lobaria immixta]
MAGTAPPTLAATTAAPTPLDPTLAAPAVSSTPQSLLQVGALALARPPDPGDSEQDALSSVPTTTKAEQEMINIVTRDVALTMKRGSIGVRSGVFPPVESAKIHEHLHSQL